MSKKSWQSLGRDSKGCEVAVEAAAGVEPVSPWNQCLGKQQVQNAWVSRSDVAFGSHIFLLR